MAGQLWVLKCLPFYSHLSGKVSKVMQWMNKILCIAPSLLEPSSCSSLVSLCTMALMGMPCKKNFFFLFVLHEAKQCTENDQRRLQSEKLNGALD